MLCAQPAQSARIGLAVLVQILPDAQGTERPAPDLAVTSSMPARAPVSEQLRNAPATSTRACPLAHPLCKHYTTFKRW
jgi:hypothetical protein